MGPPLATALSISSRVKKALNPNSANMQEVQMSGAQLNWQSDALANHVGQKRRLAIECTFNLEWMRLLKTLLCSIHKNANSR